MSRVLLRGMHGLGDTIHQRAIIRELKRRGDRVAVETPWPQLCADLADEIYLPEKSLRTQQKNMRRGGVKSIAAAMRFTRTIKNWYKSPAVRTGGYVAAMFDELALPRPASPDFSFDVPGAWVEKARQVIGDTGGRPVFVYRPLVARKEWVGCDSRNPDAKAYAALFAAARDGFYVVSVADLVPGVEWITSRPVVADKEFHKGELDIETLCGLFSLASLVFCSPGFALPLSQSVGTHVVCVYGGRENSTFYLQDDKTLGVDTVRPCGCLSHTHACVKTIDLDAYVPRVRTFATRARQAADV